MAGLDEASGCISVIFAMLLHLLPLWDGPDGTDGTGALIDSTRAGSGATGGPSVVIAPGELNDKLQGVPLIKGSRRLFSTYRDGGYSAGIGATGGLAWCFVCYQ